MMSIGEEAFAGEGKEMEISLDVGVT